MAAIGFAGADYFRDEQTQILKQVTEFETTGKEFDSKQFDSAVERLKNFMALKIKHGSLTTSKQLLGLKEKVEVATFTDLTQQYEKVEKAIANCYSTVARPLFSEICKKQNQKITAIYQEVISKLNTFRNARSQQNQDAAISKLMELEDNILKYKDLSKKCGIDFSQEQNVSIKDIDARFDSLEFQIRPPSHSPVALLYKLENDMNIKDFEQKIQHLSPEIAQEYHRQMVANDEKQANQPKWRIHYHAFYDTLSYLIRKKMEMNFTSKKELKGFYKSIHQKALAPEGTIPESWVLEKLPFLYDIIIEELNADSDSEIDFTETTPMIANDNNVKQPTKNNLKQLKEQLLYLHFRANFDPKQVDQNALKELKNIVPELKDEFCGEYIDIVHLLAQVSRKIYDPTPGILSNEDI